MTRWSVPVEVGEGLVTTEVEVEVGVEAEEEELPPMALAL